MSWRRSWAIVAIVIVVLGFATIPGLMHRQMLGLGATDLHDVASLPSRISVCGRDWQRDTTGGESSRAEIHARSGAEPILVDPLPFAPCPSGPCHQTADGSCSTVVYVRVGTDAYVDYSLSGGP